MRTQLTAEFSQSPQGREADTILRSCVHCGFCTATCPTYQLLGDELDGPRGRIYLIKQMLEGQPVTRHTLQHLDRCLTCRSCETTCPSGVKYGHLLDIGREIADQRIPRPWYQNLQRSVLRRLLPEEKRFGRLLRLGQLFRPLLPPKLKSLIPARINAAPWPNNTQPRQMIIPAGCVQSSLAPDIDAATARILDQLGIQVVRIGGCCGAVNHHLSATEEARQQARRNINAWWPLIEAGAETIISTASGCGVMLKDYGHLLQEDADYAYKAAKVAALTRDIVEVLEKEPRDNLGVSGNGRRISFHAPCTLQHGQQLGGRVETLLQRSGFTLLPVADAHLCCGSAGTYSITQPAISRQLRDNKLAALTQAEPDMIVTANIGCLQHLGSTSPITVKHWITLFDPTS